MLINYKEKNMNDDESPKCFCGEDPVAFITTEDGKLIEFVCSKICAAVVLKDTKHLGRRRVKPMKELPTLLPILGGGVWANLDKYIEEVDKL